MATTMRTELATNVVSCEISTRHISASLWVIQYQCEITQALAFPLR